MSDSSAAGSASAIGSETPLRICTRKSPLALWQAEEMRRLLAARGTKSELVPLATQGDRILDRALSEVGGKGLFVKELEEALLDCRADLAVHSAKDVPFALAPEFLLCAFPQREDPRDALVAPQARDFFKLPRGARVGTSSLRRASQLLAARPDLQIVSVRGNVATRLSRATGFRSDGTPIDESDRLDAVVLALAGLRRLGLEQHVTEILSPELSLPAAGQGALAVEVIRGSRAHPICSAFDDSAVSACVRAERAVLARMGGSCTIPIGAHAVLELPRGARDAKIEAAAEKIEAATVKIESSADRIYLRAVLAGPDARGAIQLLRAEARGARSDPERLGDEVAAQLFAQGAADLLASIPRLSGLPAPKRGGET